MRRREFIKAAAASAVAWPLAARAQQRDRMRRIGVLMAHAESDTVGQAFVAAFREGLQKLGWMEGRNLQIDTRWAAATVESIQRFAKELLALEGHTGPLIDVALSSDGRRALTAGKDGTLRLWQLPDIVGGGALDLGTK